MFLERFQTMASIRSDPGAAESDYLKGGPAGESAGDDDPVPEQQPMEWHWPFDRPLPTEALGGEVIGANNLLVPLTDNGFSPEDRISGVLHPGGGLLAGAPKFRAGFASRATMKSSPSWSHSTTTVFSNSAGGTLTESIAGAHVSGPSNEVALQGEGGRYVGIKDDQNLNRR